MPQQRPDPADPGWTVAERVADAARRRRPAGILAVGAQGALAHRQARVLEVRAG